MSAPAPGLLHHQLDEPLPATAGTPTLLLLGSLGSPLQVWAPQVAVLARRFRVLRLDLPGHGSSPAPEGPYALDDLVDAVVATLDALDAPPVHVAGVSLGGMVAMRLAAREPRRVRSLVLFCTSARLGPAQAWRERAQLVRESGTAAVAETVVGRWLTPAFARRHPDLVASLRAMVEGTDDTGYAGCCEAVAAMDLTGDLPRIDVPVLAVAGADDPATPPEHLRAIADAVPSARLEVVADAAHVLPLEHPETATQLITGHVLAVEGGSPRGLPRTDAERHAAGMRTRREVLGDAHVDAAVAGTTAFTAGFQDFITRYAWGDLWQRPGLDRRSRSMVTLAVLTTLGQEHELGMHVRAALRNGLTAAEIGEVLQHCAVYAGVPAANRAFALAQQILDGEPSRGTAPGAAGPPGAGGAETEEER
ncbi:3-oxoadipate enol-lactonase/4-carboxymuconolactone decarboxylase [Kineococcus xinjiangensis]|uniref:3-oxoadipate enol-lactonase/4-carboxymuconolactone decarboxylase n=1 Tax=Kineococcus xinjiangensis TaxID=512762 RepID=A0A2S6IPB8_9ACTN|nr:3-oxoadipate enol-lactonase [Kineococcus xinjiangensis]PPK96015.1 3-oxoadipate enol-lactonase/4-carboxymuconolactone decarboxylase [Kineococcus xinjiangensis]